jgi:hypothetical protein
MARVVFRDGTGTGAGGVMSFWPHLGQSIFVEAWSSLALSAALQHGQAK